MREVKAFEYKGNLYETKASALRQKLYDELVDIFIGDDKKYIIKKIVYRNDIQKQLIKLITQYQEELQE